MAYTLDAGNSINDNTALDVYLPNGPDGDGKAVDLSTNALLGTLSGLGGSPWVANGLQFNGVGNVNFGASAALDPGAGAWSFGFWVTTSASATSQILGSRGSNPPATGYALFIHPTPPYQLYALAYTVFDVSGYQMPGGDLDTEVAYFLAVTSNGSGGTARLYVGSGEEETCDQTGPITGAGLDFVLGDWPSTWSVPFAGIMTRVKLAVGKQWSAGEIATLAGSTTAGLVAAATGLPMELMQQSIQPDPRRGRFC